MELENEERYQNLERLAIWLLTHEETQDTAEYKEKFAEFLWYIAWGSEQSSGSWRNNGSCGMEEYADSLTEGKGKRLIERANHSLEWRRPRFQSSKRYQAKRWVLEKHNTTEEAIDLVLEKMWAGRRVTRPKWMSKEHMEGAINFVGDVMGNWQEKDRLFEEAYDNALKGML